MKKRLHYILFGMMSLLAFTGCDVHEFPEDKYEPVPFLLHLDFDSEMPFYKEVEYTRAATAQHDLRYVINAYRTDNMRGDSREADTTFVFTKSDLAQLNYSAPLELDEGTYTFRVWADYVASNTDTDKYYNTSDFAEIILASKSNHAGSNDYRDAFRGVTTATVTNPAYYKGEVVNTIDNQATVEMKRPMGKFKFVSTDIDVFLRRVVALTQEEEAQSIEQMLKKVNLDDYKIVIRYNEFMPCSFNMFTDKPADSWTDVSFDSKMLLENDGEVVLGSDYIFVNGSETTLNVSLEVYNGEGKLMSSTNPIAVPIVRSKLTVVRGEFLTSKASNGVVINPGYDGDDYNIEIY
ncbi:MAG: hypothetical protein IKT94_06000 [Rikenellaceae bacterium]|nr:hypothetical protein [Rikenellaceae bacterium]